MRRDIPTKLKTLLALGVVTIATASSAVPASALSLENCANVNTNKSVCSNAKYKYSAKPKCSLKPELKPCKDNSCTIKDQDKNDCNNGLGTNCKPGNNNDNDNNSGNTTNPGDNNDNNSGNTTNPGDNNDNDNNSGNTTNPGDNNDNNSGNTTNPGDNNDNNAGSTTGNFSAYQKEVVDLVNAERSKQGVKPLTLDAEVSSVATKKSQDMIDKNYFDHNSPTYGSPFDMLKQFGISYKTAGENIAMGQRNPKEVVNSWMNSEGHRKNILNGNFTKIGVGVAQNSNGQIYWTQMFIG
ncbi:CAP domain-containing protein [Clostridioides mangenotii]|uniref:CAP domain-containing protein n=1 Tax=Metaclostridioides mangenotii TaxID=1540 RepID=UPI001C110C8D|nr:CAP domain-containing protein [Clostridioides mangenotii]MBU5307908.1 sporulation protein [Clostridioides mangenotii]MCR1955538.1 CAP domain-containing protein [Clostridioides mangenotii]